MLTYPCCDAFVGLLFWGSGLGFLFVEHVQNYERDRADANGLRIGDDDREGDNENTDVLFGALLADLDAQGHGKY